MLLDPRMVGRALEGDVERDLEAVLAGFADQPTKVLGAAEVGEDGCVAAFVGADRPRAADVVGLGDEGVVAALSLDAADRMDGREVQHVEAEPGHVGQARLDVAEGAVHASLRRGRARKQLVPGAEARALGIDHERQLAVELRLQAAVGVARDDARGRLVERVGLQRCDVGLHVAGRLDQARLP